ncbi:arginine deiminase-related protein, partial [Vibrio parahaemolyticus]
LRASANAKSCGVVTKTVPSAYDAFSPAQRNQLATHGKLLPFDVSTIESIGGGSVRCMLGEVFLPSRKAVL